MEFLGSYSPYDRLDSADLRTLAESVEVEFFAAGTMIVPEGAEPLRHMSVIRTGSVQILDRGREVDLLTVGDTFGHVSVLSGLAPSMFGPSGGGHRLLPDPGPAQPTDASRGVAVQPLRVGHGARSPDLVGGRCRPARTPTE